MNSAIGEVGDLTPAAVMKDKNSVTGVYLSGEKKIAVPAARRAGSGKMITLEGASGNNLKNVRLEIPSGL